MVNNLFWYGIAAGLIVGFFLAINLVGLTVIISRQSRVRRFNNPRFN
ncbi:MAG: hypothetical protein ACE144_08855 [Thermodesulfobacteriota bacterium]